MKKLIILVMLLISASSCKRKVSQNPERTYVVTHSTGVDTVKARVTYTDRAYVIFFYDKVYGQASGKFDAPYSFKAIK
jgi:hypothetical protein